MNKILIEDLEYIKNSLETREINNFLNSTILITGCAGFLGYYFMNFFVSIKEEYKIKKIIGLDNFIVGYPMWLKQLSNSGSVSLHNFNIISDDISNIEDIENVDYVIHMASIASPKYYRKFPVETLDANVWGLRNLFEHFKEKQIKGFLFFSSSEIYGDPSHESIPTNEEYRGNVSCIGPRANYDEAKRFGETMCYLFHEKYQIPIRIARPFNNFGPGMRLNDARVPADFAKAVINNENIVMYSNGSPTRTFCYVSDAIIGYLKILLYPKFDYFNIGIDFPEISINQLANIYIETGKKIFGYKGKLVYEISEEPNYLEHNPSRRCPNIEKAKKLLRFNPKILVNEGVFRFLKFIEESEMEELTW